MECNKDEAIRAKGIAEKKMESTDFVGARKIAIKAQRLYPGLENIGQMICVCDVHCSAESKNSGNEKDWYDILKVEQSADEVSIKKQYRKLALLLHPDKNKFAGAEVAFMLMGEAQKVLLDREKRSFFDARYKSFSQNTAPNPPPPPANRNANNVKPPSGQVNTTKNATSNVKKQPQQQQQANNVKPPSGPTKTTKKATSHVKKQSQQPNNVKPPSGQTNTTKNATSHVKQQPQQQANNVKPPSGQTSTTKNVTSHVKQQPQQQANSVKAPSGQTNTKKNATSKQKAKSGVSSGMVTFRTVCPFCAIIYRHYRYALNGDITCQRCKNNFIAYDNMCAETTTPQSNANQTATGARGVSTQGGSCSASNGRVQGSSGQQKPGVDSFANSGQGTQVGRSKKTNEPNMGAKNINRPTSGGSDHSRMNIGKRDKKQVVDSGGSFQSKGGTSSKDTVAGSRCGGDGSSHQRSPQLKRHVSCNGIGSGDGTLNSSKRFKTSA